MIEKTGIDPSCTIFVDDKLENVLTARSFGMHGIIFDEEENVIRQLKNICGDPVSRGSKFLASHKKNFTSVSSNNIEYQDVTSFILCSDGLNLIHFLPLRIFVNSSSSMLQMTSKYSKFKLSYLTLLIRYIKNKVVS